MQTVHDEMFTIFITFNTADIFEVDTKHNLSLWYLGILGGNSEHAQLRTQIGK